MLINTQATDITEKTRQVIQENAFLQLTSSKDQYPDSKGSGLPLIYVQTTLCSAVIALQGAQLLQFSTISGQPLLWLSPNCNFTPGVALRGGVPICLPWFGVNAQDPKKQKHGFARNEIWELNSATLSEDGSAELIFSFASKANALFEFNFTSELKMTLDNSATFELKITNTDSNPFDCSWALHSYHPVLSLSAVRVKGLAGKMYLDNLENYAEKFQAEDVSFPSEVDRVFYNVNNSLLISGSPNITINHHSCPSVIVWNPGANAATIGDIGAGNEQNYICVERGAVLNEKWNLKAGEHRSAWMEFKETPLS